MHRREGPRLRRRVPGRLHLRGEEQLYIHPEECVDCDACLPACPVDAIFPADDVQPEWAHFTGLQAQWFDDHPDAAGGAMERPYAPAD